MLQKILEKVFITKKFTQCKTSCSLKIDVFEIPDNKNIEKLFSKYELLPLDQAHSSYDASQILILQFPIQTFRTSLTISIKFLHIQLKPFFKTILIMLFIGFPILSYAIQPRATTGIGYSKPYANPSQSSLISSYIKIMKLYGSNTPSIKKLSL